MNIAHEIKLIMNGHGKKQSREALKRMINTGMWDEIGFIYVFVPQWCEFNGNRTFNWASCNGEFWAAFQPESWSLEAQAKKAKARKEKQVRRALMFPPADNVT